MEPAQQAIGDGLGQELARGQVFREAGVIGRGEELVAQAVAARSQPHRPSVAMWMQSGWKPSSAAAMRA
jgi:hypothetical protein